jgi:hypothetical protein
MTREDSPIIDFYPTKLKFDPNGKKFSWQWVVLLPFIDEARLVRALESIWVSLSPWGHQAVTPHQLWLSLNVLPGPVRPQSFPPIHLANFCPCPIPAHFER